MISRTRVVAAGSTVITISVQVRQDAVGQQCLGVAEHRHPEHGQRRAVQPVVEDAQHVDVPPGDRLVDQLLGVRGRPDQHDVRGQPVQPPPPADQDQPAACAGPPGRRRPATVHQSAPRTAGSGEPQHRGQAQHHQAAGEGDRHHLGHLVGPALAPLEPVGAARGQQVGQQHGADDERARPAPPWRPAATRPRSTAPCRRSARPRPARPRPVERVRREPPRPPDAHGAQRAGPQRAARVSRRFQGFGGLFGGRARPSELSPSVVTRSL